MKTSLNSIETSVFDFTIMNFSGVTRLKAKNTPLKPAMVLLEETGAMVKLDLKHAGAVRLGDCYNEPGSDEDGRYDEDLVAELSYLTAPVSAFAYDEDEDEDEDEDDDEDAQSLSSPISIALTLNSCHALVDALHAIHFSAKDGYNAGDAHKCEHNIHVFTLKSNTDEDSGETHFGLLARRNAETGDTYISLIITQPMPMYRRFGHIRLCDINKFLINEEYGRILLDLIQPVLPEDFVDTCTFDNMLVGYTDTSDEDGDVIERLCENSGPVSIASKYGMHEGASVLTHSSYDLNLYYGDEDEDDEDAEYDEDDFEDEGEGGDEDGKADNSDIVSIASIVTPLAPDDKIKNLDAVSDFDFQSLIHRTATRLGVKVGRVPASAMN